MPRQGFVRFGYKPSHGRLIETLSENSDTPPPAAGVVVAVSDEPTRTRRSASRFSSVKEVSIPSMPAALVILPT